MVLLLDFCAHHRLSITNTRHFRPQFDDRLCGRVVRFVATCPGHWNKERAGAVNWLTPGVELALMVGEDADKTRQTQTSCEGLRETPALYHRFCLYPLWTEFLDTAMMLIGSGLVTSGSGHCFLQRMWFRWLHQSGTSSCYWSGLQTSVKQPGWESGPPNLRPWFSPGKRWSALSGLGKRFSPKQRSSSISASCSQVRVRKKREQKADRRRL